MIDVRATDATRPVVAVLTATFDELRGIRCDLKLKRRGPWLLGRTDTADIVAAVSGIGAAAASRAVAALVAAHPPRLLVHAGFAGGLDPQLPPGHVLRPDVVLDQHGGALDVARPQVRRIDVTDRGPGQGTLLCVDEVIRTPADRRTLRDRHGAAAVDMESFTVASAAAALGVRLVLVRAVCDPATMALPAAAATWVKPDGRTALARVACHALAHPRDVPAIARLAACAARARAALGAEVRRILATTTV